MRVFVTGGSGFVGRNLIRALVSAGHAVRALARSEASAAVVRGLGAEVVPGDLLDEGALTVGLTGADAVVHAAADTSQGAGSATQLALNVDGTRLVFSLARRLGVRRGVHVSSEAVLADGGPLVEVDERRPFPQRFAGGYSRSKALAETAALEGGGDGFDVVVLRPRLVWGRDDTTFTASLVAAARAGQLVWIDGGRSLTSTTHIDNLVHAILLCLERGPGGQVYFVADEGAVPFRQFATAVLESQGVTPPTREVPRWAARGLATVSGCVERLSGGRRTGPLPLQTFSLIAHEVTVNDARARRELGYHPVITRDEGLAALGC
ncbi:MAG: NAD-dependent epimerase/dehydratase family protein [Myxococcaceae bacterium]|nr:NAD-dependent epimerase/dehydratase family protein [Myxococcaceae bacterium]